jgi:hypothetical protein
MPHRLVRRAVEVRRFDVDLVEDVGVEQGGADERAFGVGVVRWVGAAHRHLRHRPVMSAACCQLPHRPRYCSHCSVSAAAARRCLHANSRTDDRPRPIWAVTISGDLSGERVCGECGGRA